MILKKIDEIEYRLRENQDFSWLSQFGTVFYVIDETGSGCINFGVKKDNKKLFFKIAGAKTIGAELNPQESIQLLKQASIIYKEIHHPNLIQYVDSFEINEFFVVVFDFAEGECLFDHWNFDKYRMTKDITPMMRFKLLSIEKRLNVVYKLFSFFKTVIENGYVAVDFYDGSIIYNFLNDEVTFCDIDLFRKCPSFNDLGENYFGTKRLKAPEENTLSAIIDESTTCFTLGALILDTFSEITNLKQRYEQGNFIPEDFSYFELSREVYDTLLIATNPLQNKRFKTIIEFEEVFYQAIRKQEQ